MGKGGRIACIFTPMILTVASLVFLVLIDVGGWTKSGGTNNFYFFQANLTGLDVSQGTGSSTLSQALALAQSEHVLSDIYQIHLWNYCSSNTTSNTITTCSKRENEFVFDPVEIWGLAALNASASKTSSGGSTVQSAEAELTSQTQTIENEILGKSGADALAAYRDAAKYMFIGYEVSLWTTVATIIFGILAIFSRWGSFITWILSFISSLITLATVLTSTVLFSILVGVLGGILKPYGIELSLGVSSLVLNWLAVLCSWAATLFWLFSVCCCSGRSNPHHRGNTGGLWRAEPKDKADYGHDNAYGYGFGGGQGRAMRVGRTGGAYQPVTAAHWPRGDADNVPLQSYAAPMPYGGHSRDASRGGFEPFRQV